MIYQPKSNALYFPKWFIKERIDQHHRQDWEDDGRYERQKAKALRYIEVRAETLTDVDKLVREVVRVFHDDLARDPAIREAVEMAVARQPGYVVPEPKSMERGEVRGVDDSDETLESLEQQLKEELTEP